MMSRTADLCFRPAQNIEVNRHVSRSLLNITRSQDYLTVSRGARHSGDPGYELFIGYDPCVGYEFVIGYEPLVMNPLAMNPELAMNSLMVMNPWL